MIKVCHMTSAHQAEDERIFHKECVSLAQAGYDVYLVAKGDSYEKKGVHVVGIGEVLGGRIHRMLNVTRQIYCKAVELDADIYHFHDPELLPYGLKLKNKGKKVIFDSHENTVEQIREKHWIPAWMRTPLYYIFHIYQKYSCSRLDAIISVTPHICEYFSLINSNVSMITNYPTLKSLTCSDSYYINSVCFAGGISKLWCHEAILQALEQVAGCVYVLCGKGTDSYMQELQGQPSWNQVIFLGVLPHEEIYALLGRCTIGLSILQYSHNTGWKTGTLGNTKIYEEMMAGLPLICTDFDLWKEFVERYHCGICVDPQNINEIADAIRYLLGHPEEAKQMGANGRKAVVEEFNWGVEEKKLLALYQDILCSRGA